MEFGEWWEREGQLINPYTISLEHFAAIAWYAGYKQGYFKGSNDAHDITKDREG